MKIQVTFKQQNPDYDREYAEQYHGGKESNGNEKDLWATSFELPGEIEKIAITEKGDLRLPMKNGAEVVLPHMKILECYKDDKVIAEFAVSKSLVKKTHKAYNEKYDITRYYFYFKDRQDFVRIGNLIYILKGDLPEELMNHA